MSTETSKTFKIIIDTYEIFFYYRRIVQYFIRELLADIIVVLARQTDT